MVANPAQAAASNVHNTNDASVFAVHASAAHTPNPMNIRVVAHTAIANRHDCKRIVLGRPTVNPVSRCLRDLASMRRSNQPTPPAWRARQPQRKPRTARFPPLSGHTALCPCLSNQSRRDRRTCALWPAGHPMRQKKLSRAGTL